MNCNNRFNTYEVRQSNYEISRAIEHALLVNCPYTPTQLKTLNLQDSIWVQIANTLVEDLRRCDIDPSRIESLLNRST